MLINDYSQLDLESYSTRPSKISLSDLLTAGMIFVLPVIFLLLIAAK